LPHLYICFVGPLTGPQWHTHSWLGRPINHLNPSEADCIDHRRLGCGAVISWSPPTSLDTTTPPPALLLPIYHHSTSCCRDLSVSPPHSCNDDVPPPRNLSPDRRPVLPTPPSQPLKLSPAIRKILPSWKPQPRDHKPRRRRPLPPPPLGRTDPVHNSVPSPLGRTNPVHNSVQPSPVSAS
jgi:hypothetical protein